MLNLFKVKYYRHLFAFIFVVSISACVSNTGRDVAIVPTEDSTGSAEGYLQYSEIPKSIALLPPPPVAGSAGFALDVQYSKKSFTLRDTPAWDLAIQDADAPALPAALQHPLTDAFALGTGHALLHLGANEVGSVLPPAWAWWRDFAARYVTALCATPESSAVAAPDQQVLEAWVAAAPPMTGAEYLTTQVLSALWHDLDRALREELAESKHSLQEFLKARHPIWNLVGRVHFNLAENRKDTEAPFAFLATYTSGVSGHGKAQHLPLSRALAELSDGKSQARLLSLLMPVQRAAEQCAWLRAMLDTGEIYHPLRWLPAEAYQFLTDVPKLEAAGIIVRAPGTWQAGRPPRLTLARPRGHHQAPPAGQVDAPQAHRQRGEHQQERPDQQVAAGAGVLLGVGGVLGSGHGRRQMR